MQIQTPRFRVEWVVITPGALVALVESHEDPKDFVSPSSGTCRPRGEPLAGVEDAPEFVDRLPLVEVARAWGLSVSLYSIEDAPDRLGYFTPGRGIALGVENLSTLGARAGSFLLLTEVMAAGAYGLSPAPKGRLASLGTASR